MMYGHTRMAMMNGGRKKSQLEGRTMVTDVPHIARWLSARSVGAWMVFRWRSS
jgi:hypothetical protein